MKRKNLIARKKVKNNKHLFKDSKILNFYKKFKSIIFKDIKNKSFALAVSGGSDSLCLAYFSKIYSSEFGNKIHILIVDHNLRKESHKESLNNNFLLLTFFLTIEFFLLVFSFLNNRLICFWILNFYSQNHRTTLFFFPYLN